MLPIVVVSLKIPFSNDPRMNALETLLVQWTRGRPQISPDDDIIQPRRSAINLTCHTRSFLWKQFEHIPSSHYVELFAH